MKKESFHLIGIGGIGMSALARVAKGKSLAVGGSDQRLSPLVEDLMREGMGVVVGHDASAITPAHTVVYTTAVKKGNPVLEAANTLKCATMHRSDFLCYLMQGTHSLAVAGTHGKTTTTALLASVLIRAGVNPSYAVGGILKEQQINGMWGKGKWFVFEADESDGSFLKYNPHGAIITSAEADHLDYYQSHTKMCQAYAAFADRVDGDGPLFFCGDDPWLPDLLDRGISYGFGKSCALRAKRYRQQGWQSTFDIEWNGVVYRDVVVNCAGRHNAYNALAVFGLCLDIGVEEAVIREALASFQGVKRRCEDLGTVSGVMVIDDYAHHPSSVHLTLESIKNAVDGRRIVALFQPHRYSRTKDCLEEYAKAFSSADEVVVTDLSSAGEEAIEGIDADSVADAIRLHQGCVTTSPRDKLAEEVVSRLRPHDVIVLLGAGDITSVGSDILALLDRHPPKKYRVAVVGGGISPEHAISLVSAKSVVNALDRSYYDVEEIAITEHGDWIYKKEVFCEGVAEGLKNHGKGCTPEALACLQESDVALPILHGPLGEDGMVQGFLDTLGIAFVGSGYAACAASMNKVWTKVIAAQAGVPTHPYLSVFKEEWEEDRDDILARVVEVVGQGPIFVKSVSSGSSLGIYRVEDRSLLPEAIDKAFCFDGQLIIEQGLSVREIEFAVMGNSRLFVPPPGEVCTGGEFYDYDRKYGEGAFPTDPEAKLSKKKIEEGCFLAEKVYRALRCRGLARVDFFLDEKERYWFNEVNPLPGFVESSLYPKVWQAQGLPFSSLIDRLIILALENARVKKKTTAVWSGSESA
ncbi:UDP-N-acetylmuramate--L-alanine ligase [Simkania negevensis]|uniref:Multifunctional fusion protein n=1 Tax=Simkania negevensis TaxID=83561 RepID=A0ABS3ARD5_9BACT|nr:UDP-N-acetylmuramate--L-alanine ligase [Simkania negevensis]